MRLISLRLSSRCRRVIYILEVPSSFLPIRSSIILFTHSMLVVDLFHVRALEGSSRVCSTFYCRGRGHLQSTVHVLSCPLVYQSYLLSHTGAGEVHCVRSVSGAIMSAASAAVLTPFPRAPRPRDRCTERGEPQDPAAHTTRSAGEPGVNAGGLSLRAFQAAQQSPHEQLPLVRGVYRQSHGRLASFTRRRTRREQHSYRGASQVEYYLSHPVKAARLHHRPDSLAQTSTDVIPTALERVLHGRSYAQSYGSRMKPSENNPSQNGAY